MLETHKKSGKSRSVACMVNNVLGQQLESGCLTSIWPDFTVDAGEKSKCGCASYVVGICTFSICEGPMKIIAGAGGAAHLLGMVTAILSLVFLLKESQSLYSSNAPSWVEEKEQKMQEKGRINQLIFIGFFFIRLY
ncbi:hypothetical protein BYT27DRAFT_7208641 [Phlegmacium glaucopus]|nr:hypothetical protein BYT27DRAFT_7208641 [Phlegmacium glaucopus]